MLNQKVSFHDSTLTKVEGGVGEQVVIELEDVYVEGLLRKAIVRMSHVREILRDGSHIQYIPMEHEDGEVLTLEQQPDLVLLIVVWHDFKRHVQTTRSYKIVCDTFTVEVR